MIPQVLQRTFRSRMWKSFCPEARDIREWDVWLAVLEMSKVRSYDREATWKLLWWRFHYDKPGFRIDDVLKCLALEDDFPVILAEAKLLKKIEKSVEELLSRWHKMGIFSYDGESGRYTFTDDGLDVTTPKYEASLVPQEEEAPDGNLSLHRNGDPVP
jgi:hypothetical protein